MREAPRDSHDEEAPRDGVAPRDEDTQGLDPLGADDGEHLSLRFFDGAPDDLAEHLALPLVDGLDLDGRVRNALDHAVTTRRGAVVIGASGRSGP